MPGGYFLFDMKNFVLVVCAVLTISCSGLVTRVILSKKHPNTVHYFKPGKDFVFVSAMHLGRPIFYQNTKKIIDSLRHEGYTILYESVKVSKKAEDSTRVDLLKRKIRKISGVYVSDYADASKNASLKIPKMKGLMKQTADNCGIDLSKDVWADYTLEQLVAKYEKERGEIVLSECDLKTEKYKKYKCSKIDKKQSEFLILSLRNRRVLHVIDSLNSNKIAILYGGAHEWGITKLLEMRDSTWVFDPYFRNKR